MLAGQLDNTKKSILFTFILFIIVGILVLFYFSRLPANTQGILTCTKPVEECGRWCFDREADYNKCIAEEKVKGFYITLSYDGSSREFFAHKTKKTFQEINPNSEFLDIVSSEKKVFEAVDITKDLFDLHPSLRENFYIELEKCSEVSCLKIELPKSVLRYVEDVNYPYEEYEKIANLTKLNRSIGLTYAPGELIIKLTVTTGCDGSYLTEYFDIAGKKVSERVDPYMFCD